VAGRTTWGPRKKKNRPPGKKKASKSQKISRGEKAGGVGGGVLWGGRGLKKPPAKGGARKGRANKKKLLDNGSRNCGKEIRISGGEPGGGGGCVVAHGKTGTMGGRVQTKYEQQGGEVNHRRLGRKKKIRKGPVNEHTTSLEKKKNPGKKRHLYTPRDSKWDTAKRVINGRAKKGTKEKEGHNTFITTAPDWEGFNPKRRPEGKG